MGDRRDIKTVKTSFSWLNRTVKQIAQFYKLKNGVAHMSRTCAVCLRAFSTTSTGLLRTHGPVTARCPGFGKLPRPLAAVPTSPGSGSPPATESTSPASPSPSPVLAQIPRVRVLKRIPKSARHQCSSKLIGGQKGRDLPRSHLFCPLSIETMGAMGPRSLELVREVGRRIALETGEPRSTDFLLQRLSVAVQRGNCASVLGGI